MYMKENLFAGLPKRAPAEVYSELVSADSVRIERIVSYGQTSPEGFWYEQERDEWVLLLEGSATLVFDDGTTVDLEPGDHLNIPGGCRHRVEKTASDGRTLWLAVFYQANEP